MTTPMTRRALHPAAGLLLAAILVTSSSGCNESLQGVDVRFDAGGRLNIVAVTTTDLVAQFGVALLTPLRVRVLDDAGRPIRSATVRFTVTGGAGVFSADTTLTNDQGFTETTFLPLSAGTVVVEASVRDPDGTDRVQFTIRVFHDPTVAGTIEGIGGDGQTAPVGSVLPAPLVVEVLNPDGFPVDSFPVTFTLQESHGQFAGVSTDRDGPFLGQITVRTDASGRARAFVRLGSEAGPHVVVATGVIGEGDATTGSETTASVTFHATATPSDRVARLVAIAGQNQTVVIDTLHQPDDPDYKGREPNPFVLQAVDAFGNPVEGVTITWFLSDGGALLLSSATVTDESGITSNLVVDVSEGRNVVVAFSPRAEPLEFVITGEVFVPAEEDGGEGEGGG